MKPPHYVEVYREGERKPERIVKPSHYEALIEHRIQTDQLREVNERSLLWLKGSLMSFAVKSPTGIIVGSAPKDPKTWQKARSEASRNKR